MTLLLLRRLERMTLLVVAFLVVAVVASDACPEASLLQAKFDTAIQNYALVEEPVTDALRDKQALFVQEVNAALTDTVARCPGDEDLLAKLLIEVVEKAYYAVSIFVKDVLHAGESVIVPSYMSANQLRARSRFGKDMLVDETSRCSYLFEPFRATFDVVRGQCTSCFFRLLDLGQVAGHRPEFEFVGRSPICRAAQYGFSFMVKDMLNVQPPCGEGEQCADPTAELLQRLDCGHTTVLHIATSNNDTNSAEAVLSAIADLNREHGDAGVGACSLLDAYNRSSLDLARMLGYDELVSDMESVWPHAEGKCGGPDDQALYSAFMSTPEASKQAGAELPDGGWHAAGEYKYGTVHSARLAKRMGGTVTSDDVAGEHGNCNIVRIDASELTAEMFYRDFASIRRPLIITGATAEWKLRETMRRGNFRRQFSALDVLVGRIPYGEVFGQKYGWASVEEFFLYLDGEHDDQVESDATGTLRNKDRMYVFDTGFLVREDVHGTFQMPSAVERVFRTPEMSAKGGDRVDNTEKHVNSRVHQFMVGPHLSGAPIHFHCHALNALLYGKKRWLLTPPAQSFYSVVQAYDWLHENDLGRYHEQEGSGSESLAHPRVTTCVQNAGEIFYVPSLWGHAVLNDGETTAMAIEFNMNDC